MQDVTEIRRANQADIKDLVELARTTFVQSHGHSASEKDIKNYINVNYTNEVFDEELSNPNYIYHVVLFNDLLVGYSKIVLDQPISTIQENRSTKLDRIYLLEEFHGLKLGKELFDFNINYAKMNSQTGIWLFTWKENKRAIGFYKKMGFVIVGEHDFKISETHSNPNWQLWLAF